MYEERITIWRAKTHEKAIHLADLEALEYVADLDGASVLDVAQSYEIGLEAPVSGSEVFSLMRESKLSPNDYLRSFFDSGSERQLPTRE